MPALNTSFETAPHDPPTLYVACLASHNAGIPHGAWLDATDLDVLRHEISDLLAASPIPDAVEYICLNADGFPPALLDPAEHDPGIALPYPDLGLATQWARVVEDHGPALIGAILDLHPGIGTDDTAARASDFLGAFESEGDALVSLAACAFDEWAVPSWLRPAIDLDRAAEQFFRLHNVCDGLWHDGRFWVFQVG